MSELRSHEQRDRALFNRIAEQYLKKDLLPSCRLARALRLTQTMNGAGIRKVGILLELGCGGGFSVEYLDGWFSRFIGIDYSDALIAFARQRHRRNNVTFFCENIRSFRPEGQVDVILMIGVLHHLEDVSGSLVQILEMLKPGGLLVVNEPHPGNSVVSAARFIRKRIDRGYSADQRELSASALRGLFNKAGYEDVAVFPQGVFSTPFAEVAAGPEWLRLPLTRLACMVDRVIETWPCALVTRLSWNLAAVGRRPCATGSLAATEASSGYSAENCC